jgi:hypothetical protein
MTAELCPDCSAPTRWEPHLGTHYCGGCDTHWTRDLDSMACPACLETMTLDPRGTFWICECGELIFARGREEYAA